MSVIKQAEDGLASLFKDLPHLPESSRESLANFWPWLALIGGIVQLWAAWILYRLADWAGAVSDYVNELSRIYGGREVGPTGMDKTVIYLGVALLVVDAVILLMAWPKLKARLRAGWDLLFLGSLLNLAYGVVQIFTFNRGFGSFIGSLVGSAIGFYLLFEVREKFSKK